MLNKRNEKDFIKRPSQMLRPTYRLWCPDGNTWMPYLRHTTFSKSNINHFIINHCSDPCLQNIHIFFLQKSLDCFPYTIKTRKNSCIGLHRFVNPEIPIILNYSTIVSEFLIFPMHIMLISLEKYTYI